MFAYSHLHVASVEYKPRVRAVVLSKNIDDHFATIKLALG